MECPTNHDPTFDGRPRIKRTTGIPKSFLKTVEKPTTIVNDGTTEDVKQPTGVMVNSEGEWVVAEPDQAAWDRYQAQTKASASAHNAATLSSKDLQDRGLECAIDKRLFVDPTKTPCCHTTYCHECIQNLLLDNDLRCPQCLTENVPIDDLIPDNATAVKILDYEEERLAVAHSTNNAGDSIGQESDRRQQHIRGSSSKTPQEKRVSSQSDVADTGVSSKKRLAEAELENNRKPQGAIERAPKTDKVKVVSQNARNQKVNSPKPYPQSCFANGNYLESLAVDAVGFPNMKGFAGMNMPLPMAPIVGMDTALQNPMLMQNAPFLGNDWSNMWNTRIPQQNTNMGGGYQSDLMFNTGSSQQNMQNPLVDDHMNGMNGHGMEASGRFANQQRSNNEEESAYFRKPVNPNRQQNRRNWNQNRPAEYHEI